MIPVDASHKMLDTGTEYKCSGDTSVVGKFEIWISNEVIERGYWTVCCMFSSHKQCCVPVDSIQRLQGYRSMGNRETCMSKDTDMMNLCGSCLDFRKTEVECLGCCTALVSFVRYNYSTRQHSCLYTIQGVGKLCTWNSWYLRAPALVELEKKLGDIVYALLLIQRHFDIPEIRGPCPAQAFWWKSGHMKNVMFQFFNVLTSLRTRSKMYNDIPSHATVGVADLGLRCFSLRGS